MSMEVVVVLRPYAAFVAYLEEEQLLDAQSLQVLVTVYCALWCCFFMPVLS